MKIDILEALLELLAPRLCVACALPVAGTGSEVEGFCLACAPLLEPSERPEALYLFAGPMQQAIHRMKYRRHSEVALALGSLIARFLESRPEAAPYEALVPIPTRRARVLQRGGHSLALMARAVSIAAGIPYRPAWLRKVRDTPPQSKLDLARRQYNLRGVFRACPEVSGKRILLLDDVRTTGCTLAEAREALLSAGAREVRMLALASTPL